MGAPKKAYERVAPPHSFIHVDDYTTPKMLAEYLLHIGRLSLPSKTNVNVLFAPKQSQQI